MFKKVMTIISISCLGGSLLLAQHEPAVVELTEANAQAFITQARKVVIIDFYADWCPPCKQMGPIFEKFAGNNKDKYQCARADFSKLQELAKKYEVALLPTFVIIKDQKVIGKFSGAHSDEGLRNRVEETFRGVDLSKLDKKELSLKLKEALSTCGNITALVNAGVDVNAPFDDGMVPLLFSSLVTVNFGDKGLELIKQLLSAGATTNIAIPMTGSTQPTELVSFLEAMITNYSSAIENFKKVITVVREHKTEETVTGVTQACQIK